MLTVVQDKAEGIQQQNKESDKEHNKELNASQSIFLEEPECIEESRLAMLDNPLLPCVNTAREDGAERPPAVIL